jgi:hypothetical protein
MDKQHPAPGIPATKTDPTKRIVRIGDYLGRFAGYAQSLKRRRVLTRSGKTIDADTLRRAPELRARSADEVRRAFYVVQEGGLVAIPAPTPPLPDRKAQVLRWLLARLSESSTYRGFFLLAGVAGWALTDEQGEALMALGVALAGAIGVFFGDKPGEGE